MYRLPKLHKTTIGVRLIIASKNCSAKVLSGVISKILKMLFKDVENFHNKTKHFGLRRIIFQLLKN